jgi:hypothetical protein
VVKIKFWIDYDKIIDFVESTLTEDSEEYNKKIDIIQEIKDQKEKEEILDWLAKHYEEGLTWMICRHSWDLGYLKSLKEKREKELAYKEKHDLKYEGFQW